MANVPTPPDPRPSKADPHNRAKRKEIEEKNPGFGWKKMLALGLTGVLLMMNIEKDVKKHEERHKQRGDLPQSDNGGSSRRGSQNQNRDDRKDGGRSGGRRQRSEGAREPRRRPRSLYDDGHADDYRRRAGGRGRDHMGYYDDDRRGSHYARPPRARTYSPGQW